MDKGDLDKSRPRCRSPYTTVFEPTTSVLLEVPPGSAPSISSDVLTSVVDAAMTVQYHTHKIDHGLKPWPPRLPNSPKCARTN
mmetsp:Transcript_20314/g.64704  ORF Transcript_20314/g.64704 Transcript_20314/m.64704 type:complete len:83 (+) Transcript_20314:978-1226(+)